MENKFLDSREIIFTGTLEELRERTGRPYVHIPDLAQGGKPKRVYLVEDFNLNSNIPRYHQTKLCEGHQVLGIENSSRIITRDLGIDSLIDSPIHFETYVPMNRY